MATDQEIRDAWTKIRIGFRLGASEIPTHVLKELEANAGDNPWLHVMFSNIITERLRRSVISGVGNIDDDEVTA